MAKKILGIGLIVLALALLGGCDLFSGGTIVIENTGNTVWSVCIKDSIGVPTSIEQKNISPEQKYEKSFDDDGTYYAYGYVSYGGGSPSWKYKTVQLSGGNTVNLVLSDF